MQNLIIKRQATIMLENYDLGESSDLYQQPRKKFKKSLQIEIVDSFSESKILLQHSQQTPNSSKFSGNRQFNMLTIKNDGSYATSSSPRISGERPMTIEIENTQINQIDHQYDDYYVEEDCYNVSMQKCNRKTMEDRAVCETLITSNTKDAFFGVYDGHTTTYVASFLKENFHKMLLNHPSYGIHKGLAFTEVFHQIDQDINEKLETQNLAGGSTALCALFHRDSLFVANVGDSKAIIIRKDKIIPLTKEHRANNEEEKNRIEQNGGWIFRKESKYLVQGRFQITRSVGDIKYKKYIICEPDILEYKLDEQDDILIMGSDGFWDLFDQEDVLKMVKECKETSGLSKYLIEKAKSKKAYNLDNITLIAVDIQKLRNHAQ
jgi:serine/threonine protein phosphatase PrpC